MAEIVAARDFPFRIDRFELGDLTNGPYLSRTAGSFAFVTGDGYVDTFEGRDFTYDGFGDPLTGQITAIRETVDGDTAFAITGLDLSVDEFAHIAFDLASRDGFAALLSGDDSFFGSGFGDYVEGFAGQDYLAGGAGADTLGGGTGNDHIYGQSAKGGQDGNDELYGDDGSDYVQGNAGDDSIDGGSGADRLIGGQGNDVVFGGFGADTINGNLGSDVVRGEDGNDSLRGGQGDDLINGGDGNDTIAGDLGVDELRGGAGADRFVFSGLGSTVSAGVDTIVDYVDGVDRIALGFTPATVLTAGPQTELSAATTAQQLFNANPGANEVAALSVGNVTYVFFANNGGATVDSAIKLNGVSATAISLGDFG